MAIVKATEEAIRSGAQLLREGKPRRVSDRDGVRARRRREQRPGGSGHIRGQGSPALQPADRARAARGARRGARASDAARRAARRGVLAGPADAGARPPPGFDRVRACDRRPRYDRHAHPRSPRRAGAAGCRRPSARRAVGQPLGPRQPDAGRARASRPRRRRRADPRRRPDRARARVDGGRCPRRSCLCCCALAPSRRRRSRRPSACPCAG